MKNMIKLLIPVLAVGFLVFHYLYLGWSIWQGLFALFVLIAVLGLDEKGPKWRQFLLVVSAYSIMISAHFWMDDIVFSWLQILLSILLLWISASLFLMLKNPEPGLGCLITFYFLGIIVLLPLGGLLLWNALSDLGYL